MHITGIFRIYNGENLKGRPAYYNKLNTFQSFLLSWQKLKEKYLIVAVDGNSMPNEYVSLFDNYADEVHYLGGLGNSASYRATFQWLKDVDNNSLIYYSEDDYLYHVDAFLELEAAADRITSADYFSLYDHLDRYTSTDDVGYGQEEIFVAGTRHWRTVESTCMTFGARAGILKKDLYLHRVFCSRKVPLDRMLWRMTRGIGLFFWKFPKRKLVSPMPSLASHMESKFLAPNVDWEAVASKVMEQSISFYS